MIIEKKYSWWKKMQLDTKRGKFYITRIAFHMKENLLKQKWSEHIRWKMEKKNNWKLEEVLFFFLMHIYFLCSCCWHRLKLEWDGEGRDSFPVIRRTHLSRRFIQYEDYRRQNPFHVESFCSQSPSVSTSEPGSHMLVWILFGLYNRGKEHIHTCGFQNVTTMLILFIS